MVEAQSSTDPPQLVDPSDVFTADEKAQLMAVWEDTELDGKFLKGRHGVTHYKIDRRGDDVKSKKGMVILSHGLGQALQMYDEFTEILVEEGFSVLRYDYFGHGYSKYTGKGGIWIKYTPDLLVDQVEDLIDFVKGEEKEEIVAFVGHSNGGLVGIYSNHRWSTNLNSGRSKIPKLILVNPAVYVQKPLLARISDRIPNTMTTLMKVIPPARVLIANNYIDAMKLAFGKNDNGEYLFPEAAKANEDENKRLFGKVRGVKRHPFLDAAIFGLSSYCVCVYLMSKHRAKLSELASSNGEEQILFVWGNKDISTPYKENVAEVEKMANESKIMNLEVLDGISHECFLEDAKAVANVVLPLLNA